MHGLYWHSEKWISNTNYHLEKLNKMEQQGCRLIQIFEDEWKVKQDIVKAKLSHILGTSTSPSLHARKCIIKDISSIEKDIFLNKFHIQGTDISRIYIGAYHDNNLVSVMTFSLPRKALGNNPSNNFYELSRFSTDYSFRIPGIFDRMLKYAKINHNITTIISYADRRWTATYNNLYSNSGFSFVSFTRPNYWYVKGNMMNRWHRYNFTKSKLIQEGHPSNLTEKEIMNSLGYERVWDCGNLKYELKL